MAKKFDLLESMGKHPGKWLLGAGALTAAKWLMNKKVGLFSMRDLLKF